MELPAHQSTCWALAKSNVGPAGSHFKATFSRTILSTLGLVAPGSWVCSEWGCPGGGLLKEAWRQLCQAEGERLNSAQHMQVSVKCHASMC